MEGHASTSTTGVFDEAVGPPRNYDEFFAEETVENNKNGKRAGGGEDAEPTGFDEFFEPQLEPHLQCPICLAALREPVQTACGHRFCRACLDLWMSRSPAGPCPVDKLPLKRNAINADRFCEREVSNLTVRCRLWQDGCKCVGPLGKLREHATRECETRCVACDGVTLPRALMAQHWQRDCPAAETVCPCQRFTACSFRGPRKDVDAHLTANLSKHLSDAFDALSAGQTATRTPPMQGSRRRVGTSPTWPHSRKNCGVPSNRRRKSCTIGRGASR